MGHPDKVADQISDAILDSLLRHDPQARCALETLVTTNLVVLAGEITPHGEAAQQALEQVEQTVRETIKEIGYDDPESGFDYRSCQVMKAIHPQSGDIALGVDEDEGHEQGAGDQGLMFGYACNETKDLMPLPIQLAHRLMERHAKVRQDGELTWLRPDAKSQVTIEYEGNKPVALKAVVLSTQHATEAVDPETKRVSKRAHDQVVERVIRPVVLAECPDLWDEGIKFHINPTGRFETGGPAGDSGVTGRKIIVDTYGGRGRHGGGAFSGKDPSKVDRSASYMARYIAKNIVAAGLAEECEVQLAYAIGVADPVGVRVDTNGTGKMSEAELEGLVREHFPLKPAELIKYLDLLRPIYLETARHGHFGRAGAAFPWEKTDLASKLA